jgi:hypothetical protein
MDKTYEEDGEVEFLIPAVEKPWREYPKGIANTPEYKARVKEMEEEAFKKTVQHTISNRACPFPLKSTWEKEGSLNFSSSS